MRKSNSVGEASSGENSTSSTYFNACLTPFTAKLRISSFALRSLYFLWISEVARKTWILGFSAFSSALAALSISFSTARARPATETPRISRAILLTDSKSPGDDTGNPASITSTFSKANCLAMLTFSLISRLAPGDCSPSRSVVSKIIMLFVMRIFPALYSKFYFSKQILLYTLTTFNNYLTIGCYFDRLNPDVKEFQVSLCVYNSWTLSHA